MEENWKKYIKNEKEKYKKIGYIECPAFKNEKIYFTNKGFNHLIRKNRKFRDLNEQIRRLELFSHVLNILKTSNKFNTYRITKKVLVIDSIINVSTAHFWSFKKKIGDRYIIVVVCQINFEPKIFMSVMDKSI